MSGSRMQRNAATASSAWAVFVSARGSISGTWGPTAPDPQPLLAASISPCADTVQMGQTVDFTIRMTGANPNADHRSASGGISRRVRRNAKDA